MSGRRIALLSPFVLSVALFACGGGSTPSQPAGSAASPAAAPPQAAAEPAVTVDPNDPCTFVTTEEANRTLGASIGAGTKKDDKVRQIVTCNWTQSNPFGILNVGVSLTPGADAYQTNMDLAPAYFDGDAKPITVASAQKAYLVVKKDQKAWVVGMLVNDKFVLIQIAIDSASAERSQALAALVAARMKP